MLFTYTQMDAPGTRLMHVLGIPIYFALLLSVWTFPYGKPFLGFIVAILGAVSYQFLYCKFLYFFVHRRRPRRPMWQFVLVVVSAQVAILVAVYSFAAA